MLCVDFTNYKPLLWAIDQIDAVCEEEAARIIQWNMFHQDIIRPQRRANKLCTQFKVSKVIIVWADYVIDISMQNERASHKSIN